MKSEEACIHTDPENRGVCGFCGNEEEGYAKPKDGIWVAACWKCVRPAAAGAAQPKRKIIGTVYTDRDEDAEEPVAKKKQGMAPSSYRPKVR